MLKLKLVGNPIPLYELEPGSLFYFNNSLCFKSEYRSPSSGAIEAFILGSGEMFWGGTSSAEEQVSLMVQPAVVVNEQSAQIVLNSDAADSAGLRSAIAAVMSERTKQDGKWGEQNHQPQFWMGILMEEVGELAQAVNETVFNNGPEERAKGGYANMRAEAVQVAAVAVAFIEMLDRNRTFKICPRCEWSYTKPETQCQCGYRPFGG